MPTKVISALLISASLLLPGSSFCQIYKWVDADGSTHFSSSPPPQGEAETVQPKATNTYSSVDQPATSATTGTKPSITGKTVVMYSAVWCGICKKAKSYFRKNGIPFSEYDIETSQKGRRDYKRLKGNGVPIILVGKQRMDGFSPGRFESMYGG